MQGTKSAWLVLFRLQRKVTPESPVNANDAFVVVVQFGSSGGPDVIVGVAGGRRVVGVGLAGDRDRAAERIAGHVGDRALDA